MTKEDFESELDRLVDEATAKGDKTAMVTAGNLHRMVGGYRPGASSRLR